MLEAARLIDIGSVEFAVDVGGASGALMHALSRPALTARPAPKLIVEKSVTPTKTRELTDLNSPRPASGAYAWLVRQLSSEFFQRRRFQTFKVPFAGRSLCKYELCNLKCGR